MTRIRKGNNLLSRGHLQHARALPHGVSNEDSSGVVDNKAIFNSIRSRISALICVGEAVETSEDKPRVPLVTFCEDDRQVESAATAKDCCVQGALSCRAVLSQVGGDDQDQLRRLHASLAADEVKEDRKAGRDPRAGSRRFQEGLLRTNRGRRAIGGLVSKISASNGSHSANVDPAFPGNGPKASNRMPYQLSGVKREQSARDPAPSKPSSSDLGVGVDPSRMSSVKRSKIECAADSSVDPPKEVNRSPWDEWGALRWYTDSGLSPHLKRPRTPHQARGIGGTSGRMARGRPPQPDSSSPEKDSLIQRSNEGKSLCPQSSSEKMKGLEPSGVASTGIFARSDAGSIPHGSKEEREPSMGRCPLQTMKDPSVENETNRDDPAKQPLGSLMHSLYLIYLGAGSRGLTVREAVTTMVKNGWPGLGEREEWITQVRGQLESNPYFIEVEEGKYFLCSSLPIDQDREDPHPEKVGVTGSKDEPPCAKPGDGKMEADSAGNRGLEAGFEKASEEATMEDSVGRPANILQGYLHSRARSIVNGRTTRGTVKSTSSDKSVDSDKCDRDSDEDFEVKGGCSGYSSGATTICGSQMSGEEEKGSADLVRRLTRQRSASARGSGTVTRSGWRNVVEPVTEEEGEQCKGGKQCARTDGRRWQCPRRAAVGYSLCEHHLSKLRMRKAHAALKTRAMVDALIPSRQRQPKRSCNSGLKPMNDTSTAESDDEEAEQIANSTHLDSKAQRKPVKNRSVMSMYH